ncbi:MAG: phage portal protein [Anaerovoracaceae bacterium]
MATNNKGPANLKRKLEEKKARAILRYKYYEMKERNIDRGIVIPPELKELYRSTLGWCTKSVDVMADRLIFREFEEDNFEMNEIFNMNNPDTLFDSAILSALISSCCFIYISPDKDGYPRLQVIDGANATGVIDPITGLMTEGYAVLEKDANGTSIQEAYFTTESTYYYQKGKAYLVTKNPAPYALLVPIIYRPDAVRPFGRSRISRAAMYFQKYAKRTLERSDVSAEFYSFPQKYVVGTNPDNDPMDKWKATISTMLEFTSDEEGNKPSLGQFTQQAMTPFIEQLRTAAAGFAGETGLTLDDLGFISDNPSSAEAIKASHETLRAAARKAQRTFGAGFLNVGYLAACLRDNFPYERRQVYLTKPKWEPVFEPDAATLSSIGDGAIKINQTVPGYFDSKTLRELTGIKGSSSEIKINSTTLKEEPKLVESTNTTEARQILNGEL